MAENANFLTTGGPGRRPFSKAAREAFELLEPEAINAFRAHLTDIRPSVAATRQKAAEYVFNRLYGSCPVAKDIVVPLPIDGAVTPGQVALEAWRVMLGAVRAISAGEAVSDDHVELLTRIASTCAQIQLSVEKQVSPSPPDALPEVMTT